MVQRRLELLKMEGLGFNQAEIVKQLSEKYQCSTRVIYYDFERRPSWQPTLLQLSDQEKILLKVINRYEQIYRQAAFKCLTAANENVRIGALKVMLVANSKICETVVLPDIISKLKALEEKARKGVFVK